MLPTSSKRDDSASLALVLKVLGVEKLEGHTPPVDLIVNGQLPVRICHFKRRWLISGIIAREASQCEEDALPILLARASTMWPTLEGNISYEKSEDILLLWKDISELKELDTLEPIISRFLEELEFWRMEAARAGCAGKDILP